MSLYTPIFPPLHEFNTSRKDSLENNSSVLLGKQQNYVKYLRDLHLFLSTHNDVLSPPSRPNSPSADRRIQKMKNKVQDIFNPSGDESSSARWARVGQTLKLRCATGRCWSVSQTEPCAHEGSPEWILPVEESEWIEWEETREENRRLKGTTNVSQQIVLATPESQEPSHAGPSQRSNIQRQLHPPDVSPGTLRAAKEKVRRWQASIVSNEWHDMPRGTSPVSNGVPVVAEGKHRITRPRRSHTLGFTVVKPAAKSFVGKKGKGSVSQATIGHNATPAPLRKSKTPTKTNVSQVVAPVDGDNMASMQTPSVKGDIARIADVSETLYLPPSFPSGLETSTPLPNPKIAVRTKPSPILPAALSTPPPSTPANPPDDLQGVSAVGHVANESSLPQPIGVAQQEKQSRASSRSAVCIPNDPPVTPPAKRPRALSQNSFAPASKHTKPISPNGALNDARDPCDAAPSGYPVDLVEMELGVPTTSGKNDQPTVGADAQDSAKIPSPAKSVKSYFSTPDSDPTESPVRANLLLESPVSPMLSYAQNATVFLPQITSTQARKGSGETSNGILGMGYSSQFDVERHVDRVSELLEKEVDFDGWLRDARTVEMTQD